MGFFGIVTYIFQMYIRPQDWVHFMYGFPLVDIIAGGTLLIALFRFVHEERPIVVPQVYFLIGFLLLVALSNIVNNTGEVFEYFILYAKRVSVFFMIFLLIRSTEQLKKITALVVILTVFLALQSVYQIKTGIGLAGQGLMARHIIEAGRVTWVGAWDGPNVLCLLFVIAIALSSGFISSSYSVLWRMLNIVFVGILTFGVYLTNSRGGFLGLLAVIFLFLWSKLIRERPLLVKMVSLTLSLFCVLVVFKFGPVRMAELNTKEASAGERSWMWEQAVDKTREKPVTGIGKGQFHFSGYTAAHNNFIQNMVEMGLPGLFIYISLVYLSLKGLYMVSKNKLVKEKDPVLSSLSSALFVGMAGYTVITFFVTMELDILFFWFGLCAVVVNIARAKVDGIKFGYSLKDAGAVLMGMAMVLFAIYLISFKEII